MSECVIVAGSEGKSTTITMLKRIVSPGRPRFEEFSGQVTADAVILLKAGLAGLPDGSDGLIAALPESALVLLNADDGRIARLASTTAARVQLFGLDETADLSGVDIEATRTGTRFTLVTGEQRIPVSLRILGEHNVMNALAAIGAARGLGIPIEDSVTALEDLQAAGRWRMEVLETPEGITVINDASSASPDSTSAALKTLAQVAAPGRSFAILGEMPGLGADADEQHDRIGRLAVRLNVAQLIVVGHEARHIHNAAGLEGSWDGESVLVGSSDEAYDVIRDRLRPGDVVLVKSSAAAGLGALGDRIAGVDS